MEPIWKRAKKDPQCDVIVAPVPYYYKDYDGSSRTDAITEMQFPSEVEMTDAGKMTAEYLELLRPEIVVIRTIPGIRPSAYYRFSTRKICGTIRIS